MKKNFIYTLLALLVAGILPFTGMAQPYIDLLNLKTQYFAPQTPTTNDGDANTKMSERQYEGAFLLPLVQKNNDIIMIGGDMYHLNFQTAGNDAINTGVTSASLNLGYQKTWNKKWQTMLMAIPKVNGQTLQLSSND